MVRSASTRELGREILREVSRSFALTLWALPRAFRDATSVAYLLARASDTIADAPGPHRAQRLEWLQFWERPDGPLGSDQPQTCHEISSFAATANLTEGERDLLRHLGDLVRWGRQLPDWQQEAIRDVTRLIVRGQRWDVEYFPAGLGGSGGEGVRAVDSAEVLQEYTFNVAGSVGEFWTYLGFGIYGPKFSKAGEEELLELGARYGCGLQLVNILRDVAEDFDRGRCYLPVDAPSPEAVMRVLPEYLGLAEEKLRCGLDYARLLRRPRVRRATVLPALLGLRTVSLLRGASWEELGSGVKITRGAVRRELVRAGLGLW